MNSITKISISITSLLLTASMAQAGLSLGSPTPTGRTVCGEKMVKPTGGNVRIASGTTEMSSRLFRYMARVPGCIESAYRVATGKRVNLNQASIGGAGCKTGFRNTRGPSGNYFTSRHSIGLACDIRSVTVGGTTFSMKTAYRNRNNKKGHAHTKFFRKLAQCWSGGKYLDWTNDPSGHHNTVLHLVKSRPVFSRLSRKKCVHKGKTYEIANF